MSLATSLLLLPSRPARELVAVATRAEALTAMAIAALDATPLPKQPITAAKPALAVRGDAAP